MVNVGIRDRLGNEIAGDTRQFQTHGQWCSWLQTLKLLDSTHIRCIGKTSCGVGAKTRKEDNDASNA